MGWGFPSFWVSKFPSFQVTEFTSFQVSKGEMEGGPMRGLELIMWSQGQWEASKKTCTQWRTHLDKRTWRLYDWNGPVGPIQWTHCWRSYGRWGKKGRLTVGCSTVGLFQNPKKVEKREKSSKQKKIKIVTLHAKISNTPFDHKFFPTSGSGCFAMAKTDRQTHRRTSPL